MRNPQQFCPHHKWEWVGAALGLKQEQSLQAQAHLVKKAKWQHPLAITILLWHWYFTGLEAVSVGSNTHTSGIAIPSGKALFRETKSYSCIPLLGTAWSASGIICYPTFHTARERCSFFRTDSWEENCGAEYWGHLPQTTGSKIIFTQFHCKERSQTMQKRRPFLKGKA